MNELDRKILQVILERDGPVTNGELEVYCGAAVNTIRKEITLINDEMAPHGFRISARKGTGNIVEILDEEKAQEYLAHLRGNLTRRRRMGVRASSQVYCLARCVLSGEGHTLEQLCRDLYCSRKSLVRDLDTVREILGEYRLNLVNLRGGRGLSVLGSEWQKRQCLLGQQKIYLKEAGEEEGIRDETAFRSLFFMDSGEVPYDGLMTVLKRTLGENGYFAPIYCLPKLVRCFQLSVARRAQVGELTFSRQQTDRVRTLPEYRLMRIFCKEAERFLAGPVPEKDVCGLAMLLSAFGMEGAGPDEEKCPEECAALREEAQDFEAYLCETWGFSEASFTESFLADWAGFLYHLKNRLVFEIRMEREAAQMSRRKGSLSPDVCLLFARFYEERHGVRLDREDVAAAFPLLDRISPDRLDCLFVPDILVVSQYGRLIAGMMGLDLRRGYAQRIGRIRACDPGEPLPEGESYDLLLTDLEPERQFHVSAYGLPVLCAHFHEGRYRCPDLDSWMRKRQWEREKALFGADAFLRTDCTDEEDLLEWVSERTAAWWNGRFSPSEILAHLRENEGFLEERCENGAVFLPVLPAPTETAHLSVLINRGPLSFGGQASELFVCYSRTAKQEDQFSLNEILRRLELSSPSRIAAFGEAEDPLSVLYPEN